MTEEAKETDKGLEVSWCQRTFRALTQGSMRASIFILASTAMGAGFLAIPTTLQNTGVFIGLFLIIFSGYVMYLSHSVIARAALKYDNYHYSTVTTLMLGKPLGVLLELAVILNGLGILVAYQICSNCHLVGTFMHDVFNSIGISFKDDTKAIIVVIMACIVTPLGLFRSLAVLRYKAMFNVTCLTYILVLVIAQFPYYSSQHGFDGIVYGKMDLKFFNAFALCLFAYLCQQNLAKVEGELVNRSERRMKKVILRAVGIQGSLFVLLALFGYLSFLGNTPGLIIMRHAAKGIHHDWMMVLARFMESFTLTFAMPLNLSPARASIEKLFFRVEGQSSLAM